MPALLLKITEQRQDHGSPNRLGSLPSINSVTTRLEKASGLSGISHVALRNSARQIILPCCGEKSRLLPAY